MKPTLIFLILLLTQASATSPLSSQWILLNAPTRGNSDNSCSSPSHVSVSGGILSLTLSNDAATCTDSIGSETLPTTGAFIYAGAFNFTYGTVEFRAMLPPEPANNNISNWPWAIVWLWEVQCQATIADTFSSHAPCVWFDPAGYEEVDIMEAFLDSVAGYNQFTIHYNNNLPNTSTGTCGRLVETGWHTYTMDWTPGSMVFTYDGVPCTRSGVNIPSHAMFPIIYNLNVNTGPVNTGYPVALQVDYIKITANASTTNPCSSCSGTVLFNDDFNTLFSSQSRGAATHRGASTQR